jgi:hypothetical protein
LSGGGSCAFLRDDCDEGGTGDAEGPDVDGGEVYAFLKGGHGGGGGGDRAFRDGGVLVFSDLGLVGVISPGGERGQVGYAFVGMRNSRDRGFRRLGKDWKG